MIEYKYNEFLLLDNCRDLYMKKLIGVGMMASITSQTLEIILHIISMV
jgi:hypothetical protein